MSRPLPERAISPPPMGEPPLNHSPEWARRRNLTASAPSGLNFPPAPRPDSPTARLASLSPSAPPNETPRAFRHELVRSDLHTDAMPAEAEETRSPSLKGVRTPKHCAAYTVQNAFEELDRRAKRSAAKRPRPSERWWALTAELDLPRLAAPAASGDRRRRGRSSPFQPSGHHSR